MIFSRKQVIDNIKQFSIFSNNLFLLTKQKELINDNKVLLSCYGIERNDNGLFCYSNMSNVETTIIFKNSEKKKFLNSLNASCFNGKNTLVFSDYNQLNQTYQVGLIDVSLELIKWLPYRYSIGLNIRKNDTIFYIMDYVIIKSLSLFTGEYLWETQLNRNGEIFKILGIRADELIVCWKRGDRNFGLLGINIHTGEIAWNMDDNDLLNGHTLNFSPDGNALFCVKNGGLKSYYLELDLVTKKNLRFDEIPKFFELGLVIERIWVKDDLIYFLAKKDSKFSTVAGVMDYKTLAILWWEQVVQGSWAYLSDLQVDKNKLYVLDGEGVLHIFERETT